MCRDSIKSDPVELLIVELAIAMKWSIQVRYIRFGHS